MNWLKLALVGVGAWILWRLLARKEPDPLTRHLAEEAETREIGRITTTANVMARRNFALETRVQPSGNENAVLVPGNGGYNPDLSPEAAAILSQAYGIALPFVPWQN